MATLRQLLAEVGQDLRDLSPSTPHISFPESQLIAWINDGESLLFSFRPDLFSHTRVITLAQGAQQNVEGCGVFSSIVSTVNKDGTETPVRKASYVASQAWTKPACAPPPNTPYKATSFRFDPNQKTTFYVEPPVPPGQTAQVKIVCAECPPALTLVDLDNEFDGDCYRIAMVKQYIYSQAFSMDSDQTNLALAQYHGNLWASYLIGKARADTAFSGGRPTPQGGPTVPARAR